VIRQTTITCSLVAVLVASVAPVSLAAQASLTSVAAIAAATPNKSESGYDRPPKDRIVVEATCRDKTGFLGCLVLH
jgi:hypothetical protein